MLHTYNIFCHMLPPEESNIKVANDVFYVNRKLYILPAPVDIAADMYTDNLSISYSAQFAFFPQSPVFQCKQVESMIDPTATGPGK